MWQVLLSCALVSAVLGSPLAASAATLDWVGTVFVRVGAAPPLTITGAGVATVNGAGGLGHLTTLRLAGGITGTSTVPPGTGAIKTITVKATLGTGTLAPISGGGPLVSKLLPVMGTASVAFIATGGCPGGLFCATVPLTSAGNGIGLGGTVNGGAGIDLMGGPWTVATAVVTYTTPSSSVTTTKTTGFAHGPTSGSSTANIGGVVQLVTPTLITSGLAADTPILTALRLRFVPEPGQLMLLAPGVALLILLGRVRRSA